MIKQLALGVALLVFGSSLSSAQSLPNGTWTGTATPPGEAPLALTFEVINPRDSLIILIRTPDRGDYPVSDLKLAGEMLTFKFMPAIGAVCSLKKQENGSFVGECVSEGGMSLAMVMMPPAEPGG